jgi:hypothetical protein
MPLPENCHSTSWFTTGYKRLAEGEHNWLLVRLAAANDAAEAAATAGGCCCVSASLKNKTLEVMLEIRGNMGQGKSEDRDFKE